MPFNGHLLIAFTAAAALCASQVQAVPFATPTNLPAKIAADKGQSGFNDCRKRYGDSRPDALCQNAYVNSETDFCFFAPPKVANVEDVEPDVVSYCTKRGYGTRLVPAGTFHGIQFIKTKEYIQLAALGDFTKVNVKAKNEGSELDFAGPTSFGNPVGSLVYTSAWTGQYERTKYWHEFLSYNEFSFRACNPRSKVGYFHCPHIYDEMGAQWNDPGRYEVGLFESCEGEPGEYPGFYNGKQWRQGQKPEPPAHAPAKTYNCKNYKALWGLGGKAALIPQS